MSRRLLLFQTAARSLPRRTSRRHRPCASAVGPRCEHPLPQRYRRWQNVLHQVCGGRCHAPPQAALVLKRTNAPRDARVGRGSVSARGSRGTNVRREVAAHESRGDERATGGHCSRVPWDERATGAGCSRVPWDERATGGCGSRIPWDERATGCSCESRAALGSSVPSDERATECTCSSIPWDDSPTGSANVSAHRTRIERTSLQSPRLSFVWARTRKQYFLPGVSPEKRSR
jgi:hypothetical protein